MANDVKKVVEDLKKTEAQINANVKSGVVTPELTKKKETPSKPLTLIQKLRKFAEDTDSIWIENAGTPQAKFYANKTFWMYVIELNECIARIDEVWSLEDANCRTQANVYAKASIVDSDGNIWGNATMCAQTSEQFLKDKPLSAAYGLAQTRAICRAAAHAFGSQAALARLEPIAAEELDTYNIPEVKYNSERI